MIFFRILPQNTFLHLLSNFSVSKVSITWTRAQTVTELGGNRANLMRQIRKNVAKKRYTISKSSEILRWIYDFFRILIWNTLSHTMLSFGVSRNKMFGIDNMLSFGVSRFNKSFTNTQTVTKCGGYLPNLLI